MNRILCLRPDGLGDMVCATPAFESLKAAFPDAQLTVVASPLNAPILEGNPHVSEVLLYDGRSADASWRKKLLLAERIRRRRFDALFSLRTAADTHFFAAWSGARIRVGYGGKPFDRWLTHRLAGGHGRGISHEIDRNYRLLETVGIPLVTRKPRLYLSDEERDEAIRRLAERGVLPEQPLIGVHPGASAWDRCYPEEKYAHAATVLARELEGNACVLVFGGPGDEERVERLASVLEVPHVRLTGLSIREMAAEFSLCRLMLLNDSGPMHLAAALGTPLVALFGYGDSMRWFPSYHANARLVRSDTLFSTIEEAAALLAAIPTERVIEAGRPLLA